MLVSTIKRVKEIKGIHVDKEEIKPLLFADDLIIYIENPKESNNNKNVLKVVSELRNRIRDEHMEKQLYFCILFKLKIQYHL